MKKIAFLFILITNIISCQNNKTNDTDMNNDKFPWRLHMSIPVGYPVRIYAGRVGSNTISGSIYWDRKDNWGLNGTGEGEVDDLPESIDIAWLSYAENCFYRVKAPLDYEKILYLFREGFYSRTYKKEPLYERYENVGVGLAPGGVVIVWVGKSSYESVEVGRYQADKIEIPEPEGLDSHESLIFSEEHRKDILENDGIIPKEFREAHKGKPIPYGLWDAYRDKQFVWYPSFELHNGGIMGDYEVNYRNGEYFWTPYTEISVIEDVSDEKADSLSIWCSKKVIEVKRTYSLPREIDFTYKASDGEKYRGRCIFDWDEVLPAFEKVFGKEPDKVSARLHFRINYPNTYFVVSLRGSNGVVVPIPTKDLVLYTINKRYYEEVSPFD